MEEAANAKQSPLHHRVLVV
jgi:hypothetical protein